MTETLTCDCGADIEVYRGGPPQTSCYRCRISAAKAKLQDRQTQDTTRTPRSIWERNPELVARLIELAESRVSYAVIGSIMGLSRNAVLSKAQRLGIEKPPPPPKRSAKRVPPAPRRSPQDRPRNGLEAILEAVEAPSDDVVLQGRLPHDPGSLARMEALDAEDPVPERERRGVADLHATQCRWPIGDPQDESFHFCHRNAVRGISYCETHARRAVEPPEVQRSRYVVRVSLIKEVV